MKKFKDFWRKLIEEIANQNKSTFGEGGLNCCDLSKDEPNKKSSHSQ